MKNLVFNSDDFGISEETNLAIMEGYSEGAVTSTCILANGKFYKHGIDEVLPEIPSIGRGVHLNIIEGKSLTAPSLIINSDREFNKGYAYFLYNSCNKKFLKQISFTSQQDFADNYEGGESMLKVAQRVYNFLDEIKKDTGKTYLIVAHNGIARIVHSYFFDESNEEFSNYSIDNCGLVRYQW